MQICLLIDYQTKKKSFIVKREKGRIILEIDVQSVENFGESFLKYSYNNKRGDYYWVEISEDDYYEILREIERKGFISSGHEERNHLTSYKFSRIINKYDINAISCS